MKRISLIRRRRYFFRSVVLGFAVAMVAPVTASADPYQLERIQLHATSGVTAEDDHGLSAGTGFVLPTAERNAVEAAQSSGFVYRRADDFSPPRDVTVPTVSTGSTIDWSGIALWSSIGLVGLLGALGLALATVRRGPRTAH